MIRMIRLPEVRELTGASGTTIWRWERCGRFPARRSIGPGIVGWRSDEIEKWIRERPTTGEGTATDALRESGR